MKISRSAIVPTPVVREKVNAVNALNIIKAVVSYLHVILPMSRKKHGIEVLNILSK
jgi:hypothetical protein